MSILGRLRSPNPHWYDIHVPAHLIGFLALVWALSNPSWVTVASFLIFNLWISGLGMSVGFHRYFTHRAFTTNRFWQRVMLIGGTLAGQGSVIFWVALHRMHHPNSDNERDIHSPKHKGFWNAYMGWIFHLEPKWVSLSRASDLVRDPWCAFFHRHYRGVLYSYWMILLVASVGLPDFTPFAAGAMIAGMWAIHQEALVNSVCHSEEFGTAPWNTEDGSRDVHGLHWITWGQSLHNSHHAAPARANFGPNESWPDLGYRLIRMIGRSHD